MLLEKHTPARVVESSKAEALIEMKEALKGFAQKDVGYSDIQSATHELANLFDGSKSNEPKDLRSFVLLARAVNDARDQFFKGLTKDERDRIDETFPDRGEIFRVLTRIQYEALDRIPFEELSAEEKTIYIKSMVEAHGEHYGEYRSKNYYFGFPRFDFEKTEDRKLLEAIVENKERVLTDEEIQIVYQAERNTYKIHLNVPPQRKIEVLKAILAAQRKDNQIVQEIFDEKRKAGESVSASRSKIRGRGGRLASVNQYKMSEVGLGNSLAPDFVFYPTPSQGQTAQEALVEMVHEIISVLADLDLPPVDRVPRFSTPVKIDGEEIPGMTFVQGNGDLKAHLLVNQGIYKLGQYYDQNRNWAVRKEEEVSFDKN